MYAFPARTNCEFCSVSSLKKNIVDTSTPSVVSLVFDITMNPRHEFMIRGSAQRVEAFKYLGCLIAQDDDTRDCKPNEFKSPLGLLTVACGNWIKLSSGGWNMVGRLTMEFKGVLFS